MDLDEREQWLTEGDKARRTCTISKGGWFRLGCGMMEYFWVSFDDKKLSREVLRV